ncbi:DNA repair protein RAD57 [Pseudomassariella vexata]|uniref:DNA repair protein RAD57 n=1 Tax=Pseudomassariella vexata TaxID=1141098 RepID=A0A1Y2DYW4_9PEZI|nr:DNA repair protein RAD57 [Pseudomassariella vexata]ORY64427.1 DNA repair protein RAD57 [Pseudomassariella vexata]
MTDLSRVLPDFPTAPYANLLHNIEKHQVTTSDLLTVEVTDLAKRAQLPVQGLERLCNAVLEALHVDLGVSDKPQGQFPNQGNCSLKQTGTDLTKQWSTISTLDDSLDRALGGGIPTGYVTEITGESGAGKTQFLLTLLLSVQLPPPHGLGRPAMYISTEAPLSTKRLFQILSSNPSLRDLDRAARPSTDNILSTVTPDLESQDHILQFQVPVEVSRRNVGLLVLDSVAANYRAEFEREPSGAVSNGGLNMAQRSNELVRLGQLLHELARKHKLAVVVANQVADRFSTPQTPTIARSSVPFSDHHRISQDSPLAHRTTWGHQSKGPQPSAEPTSSEAEMVQVGMLEPWPEAFEPPAPAALLLDHQQRWFTGWGDDPYADYALKTPSLGLVWSTQLACRIALFRQPVYGRQEVAEDDEMRAPTLKTWRRWMKVVFAPHVAPSGQGLSGAVEYEVTMGGVRGVKKGT